MCCHLLLVLVVVIYPISVVLYILQVTVELIPLLQQSDLENCGVIHVGERVMLVSLAKAIESKLLLCLCS